MSLAFLRELVERVRQELLEAQTTEYVGAGALHPDRKTPSLVRRQCVA